MHYMLFSKNLLFVQNIFFKISFLNIPCRILIFNAQFNTT